MTNDADDEYKFYYDLTESMFKSLFINHTPTRLIIEDTKTNRTVQIDLDIKTSKQNPKD